MRSTTICLAILLTLPVTVLVTACRSDPSQATADSTPFAANATVERIVDGDTIDVRLDGRRERVRMIGIDTPETKRENTPVECFGPEATAHTTALLPIGTPVHLQRDVVSRDDYGRLLAYVYLASDGTFVNLQLVRRGFARPLTIRPNVAHSTEIVEAARAAEVDNVGLWARCTG